MATAAANEVHNESSSEDNYNNAAAMEESIELHYFIYFATVKPYHNNYTQVKDRLCESRLLGPYGHGRESLLNLNSVFFQDV